VEPSSSIIHLFRVAFEHRAFAAAAPDCMAARANPSTPRRRAPCGAPALRSESGVPL